MTTRGVNDDIISRLEALEQVVRDLCTQPVMSNASQRGGTYSLFPASGTQALESVGNFKYADGSSQYGHSFYDQNGSIVLSITNGAAGIAAVNDHGGWVIPVAQSITSTTWVTLAETEVLSLSGDIIQFRGFVSSVPAGTTLQLRLFDGYGSTAYGSPATVAGSYSGNYICKWAHNQSVGWNDPRSGRLNLMLMQLQAQLSVGTGPVSIFPPRGWQSGSSSQWGTGSSTTPLTFQ